MQKHVLLNAVGVAALSLFCACGSMEKKEEAKPVEHEMPKAENAAQAAVDVTAQAAPATEAPAAPAQEVAQAATEAPAAPAEAPVAEQKA